MGGACRTYGGEERRNIRFWWGNLRERENLGDPAVDVLIILRWIFMKLVREGMDWIELAQDRDRWRGICECGNEPSRPIMCGEFLD
jgi:hypothetical protein